MEIACSYLIDNCDFENIWVRCLDFTDFEIHKFPSPSPMLPKLNLTLLLLSLSLSNLSIVNSYNPLNTLHAKDLTTPILHIDAPYGFGSYGYANLTLKSLYVSGRPPPSGYSVNFLLRQYYDQSEFAVDYENGLSNSHCLASTPLPGDVLLNASDPLAWNQAQSVSHEFTEGDEGLYFLTFQRCSPSTSAFPTSFTFTHEFYNLDRNGEVDYLSAGEQPLPNLYLTFCFSYLVAIAVWLRWIKKAKQQSETLVSGGTMSQTDLVVHHIHHMMTALLVLKILTLFSNFMRYHYISVNGTGEIWSVFYYIFTFLRGIFLFVLILLIGR